MIRFTGSAPTNRAIVALASPTKNFAQIRADKDREMQMLTMMAEQQRVDRVQLQQSIAEQRAKYQQIKNLSFLAPDQNRINMVADELEKSIKDKIKSQYSGNVQKYIEDGSADSDFETFTQAIKNSDAFQKANSNKLNMAQYIEDQKSGKIPMLVGGGNVKDVYSQFMSGQTDSFDYQGSYQAPKDWAKRIQDSYGSDRFTKEAATPQRVLLELQQDGLTAQQAVDYYTQAGLSMNPIYHKVDDIYAKQQYEEESALRKARINKLNEPTQPKEPTGGAPYMDVLSALKVTSGPEVNRNFMGKNEKFSVSGPLSKAGMDLVLNYVNGKFDEKTGYYTVPRGTKLTTADGTTQISGISHFYNPRVVVKKDPLGRQGPEYQQAFIQVDGMMTEADAEKEGSKLSNGKSGKIESFFANDEVAGGSAIVKKVGLWDELWNNADPNGFKYEVKDLLIPIDNSTLFEGARMNDIFSIGPKSYNPSTPSLSSGTNNPLDEEYL